MDDKNSYRLAGVNLDAGQRAVELMRSAVQATYTSDVLSDVGAFGGLFAAGQLNALKAPVLVASTDGVGTKTMVAARMNRWDTIGQDLVNHCVNDILVQGARPLFFLDYVAAARLDPEQIATIVAGCARACRQVGCALLGGETAEMPGVYQPGEIDLVGTIVGLVDRADIIDGSRIRVGDSILALASTGLHTNGYSFARKVLADVDWGQPHSDLPGESVGSALLAVHRCYLREIMHLRNNGIIINGLAHITGGGVIDNLPRILPDRVGAVIRRGTWPEAPIFRMIQELGRVSTSEMFRAFNMGLGMLIVLPREQVTAAQALLPNELSEVGEIVEGSKEMRLV